MTQILAALTQDYVLVASDRRLTFASGPAKGKVADDDTCKLVSLCGVWGIAFTGFAKLEGMDTHKWIAVKLAKQKCSSPHHAAGVLADAAATALRLGPFPLEQTFVIAGWKPLPGGTLRPHFLLISNMYEQNGTARSTPGASFHVFERVLGDSELYAARVVGQPLEKGRGNRLFRHFRRMLKHRVGPQRPLEALVQEIVHSSKTVGTVGTRVLAFSIPKAAAVRTFRTGEVMLVADLPNRQETSFCYFDPVHSLLRQYGPTLICRDSAVTDVEVEDDRVSGKQSSSMRILHMPESGQLMFGPAVRIQRRESTSADKPSASAPHHREE